jgi:hypothetical protein
MKLNLLPTSVSKGRGGGIAAIVVAAIIVAASFLGTVAMSQISGQQVSSAKAAASQLEAPAANAVKVGGEKTDVINNAKGVILNALLADAMMKHNSAYPDFYDKILPHIPSFFRISSMSAVPLGETTSSLTLTGVIHTQQQYRDLMLALNRIPGVTTVTRSGFEATEQYVPGLTSVDQHGRPILRGENQIPDDPLEQLNYYIQKGQAGSSGFTGAGGFGTGESGQKGAMPGWSSVTVTVVLPADLQAPNPRQTLASLAAGASTTTTGGTAAGGMMGPTSMPGGVGGMPTGAPTGAPAGPSSVGGSRSSAD